MRAGEQEECEEGEPGLLVCRGANCMQGYVNSAKLPFSPDGWYLGLGDIGFFLGDKNGGGESDWYWISRTADVIIKGGANYSAAQVASLVQGFLCRYFEAKPEGIAVAAAGVKFNSEHEDLNCALVELSPEYSHLRERIQAELPGAFDAAAGEVDFTDPLFVPKRLRPDLICVGCIPRTFKGSVDFGQLKKLFLERLQAESGSSPHSL